MVFELVKNSLRAVQERFMNSDKIAPPVRIIVADGIEDVTIKVLCHCSIEYMVGLTFMFSCTMLVKLVWLPSGVR